MRRRKLGLGRRLAQDHPRQIREILRPNAAGLVIRRLVSRLAVDPALPTVDVRMAPCGQECDGVRPGHCHLTGAAMHARRFIPNPILLTDSRQHEADLRRVSKLRIASGEVEHLSVLWKHFDGWTRH
jgi:hypothetical protein